MTIREKYLFFYLWRIPYQSAGGPIVPVTAAAAAAAAGGAGSAAALVIQLEAAGKKKRVMSQHGKKVIRALEQLVALPDLLALRHKNRKEGQLSLGDCSIVFSCLFSCLSLKCFFFRT